MCKGDIDLFLGEDWELLAWRANSTFFCGWTKVYHTKCTIIPYWLVGMVKGECFQRTEERGLLWYAYPHLLASASFANLCIWLHDITETKGRSEWGSSSYIMSSMCPVYVTNCGTHYYRCVNGKESRLRANSPANFISQGREPILPSLVLPCLLLKIEPTVNKMYFFT